MKGDGCLKPRCLNVTSMRRLMIILGGCVKPRCLNVTSILMIKVGGYVKPSHQYTKGDDHRWWIRET